VPGAAAVNPAGTRRFTETRDGSDRRVDNDRERIARPDAPLKSKRPITERSVSDELVPADQSRRRPHVLETLSTVPVRHEAAVETTVSSRQLITPEIPASQFSRVRAWVKYGMTVAQIAQTYGVAVSEIERILRQSRQ
jgi:hypothetical protein